MGDIADAIIEQEIERMMEGPRGPRSRRRRRHRPIFMDPEGTHPRAHVSWTTADGRVIRLPDMGDGHLLRVLALMDGNWQAIAMHRSDQALMLACIVQGDMAEESLDREAERWASCRGPEDVFYQYEDMVEEADARGLLGPDRRRPRTGWTGVADGRVG